jgi:hypothetical protein
MRKKPSTIQQLRSLVEKDVVKKCEENVVAGFQKHGYTRNEIVGALMIMALPYGAREKSIDPKWLEIMETYRNNFNSLVNVLMERAISANEDKGD